MIKERKQAKGEGKGIKGTSLAKKKKKKVLSTLNVAASLVLLELKGLVGSLHYPKAFLYSYPTFSNTYS